MGPSHHLGALSRYGLAVSAVGLALIATDVLTPLRTESPSSLFFGAVLVASYWGGLGHCGRPERRQPG